MSTAKTIVEQALQILNLDTELVPASPKQVNDCFTALKSMLSQFSSNGVQWVVGTAITIPSIIGDELSNPEDVESALSYSLAKRYAPFGRATMDGDAKTIQMDLYRNMLASYQPLVAQTWPKSLPLGQGNDDYGQVFFSGNT